MAGDYRKISVNLPPHTDRALTEINEQTGENQTTILIRGVELYAFVQKALAEGGKVYVETSEGERERIHFL